MHGFHGLAAHHPALWERYAAYIDKVWASDDLPVGTLELCRVRIAQLLGLEDETRVRIGAVGDDHDAKLALLEAWTTAPPFTAADRAALAFAEQYLVDAQALDEVTCARVVATVGPAGLVTLAVGVGLAESLSRSAGLLAAADAGRHLGAVAERAAST